jgi:hypothetical protein
MAATIMSKSLKREIRKLARKAEVMGGYIWICVDCDYAAQRVHEERWARNMAEFHVDTSGHTVRMLRLK